MGFPKITKQDLIAKMHDLGVGSGELVYVASYLPILGNSPTIAKDTIEALKTVVGLEGTIVMPVFNWDYCNGGVFDSKETPSQTGVLTEAFRKSDNVLRSVAPPWCTFAAYGKKAEEIVQIRGTSPFGSDGIPQYLYDENATYLLIGSTYNESAIHVHWLEEKYEVPYRFWKQFKGNIRISGELHQDISYMYARRIDLNVSIDSKHITDKFDRTDMVKKMKLGLGEMRRFRTRDYVGFVEPYFKNDRLAVLKPEFRGFFETSPGLNE